MDKVVRAVDVGYGNTKYVTGVEGNALRCAHFASSAPVCASHEAREALGGKRRTLGIGIGDFTYEVGPDAHLAADVYQTRQMHDGYCETPEYLALTRGAQAASVASIAVNGPGSRRPASDSSSLSPDPGFEILPRNHIQDA